MLSNIQLPDVWFRMDRRITLCSLMTISPMRRKSVRITKGSAVATTAAASAAKKATTTDNTTSNKGKSIEIKTPGKGKNKKAEIPKERAEKEAETLKKRVKKEPETAKKQTKKEAQTPKRQKKEVESLATDEEKALHSVGNLSSIDGNNSTRYHRNFGAGSNVQGDNACLLYRGKMRHRTRKSLAVITAYCIITWRLTISSVLGSTGNASISKLSVLSHIGSPGLYRAHRNKTVVRLPRFPLWLSPGRAQTLQAHFDGSNQSVSSGGNVTGLCHYNAQYEGNTLLGILTVLCLFTPIQIVEQIFSRSTVPDAETVVSDSKHKGFSSCHD